MKILHLTNIAGVPAVLAGEQRSRGHDAEVWQWNRTVYRFELSADFEISQLGRFLVPFEDFDVIHCHSCGVWPKYLERFFRFKHPKILYHHHGSDCRFEGCRIPDAKGPHLVSTKDLLKWCPKGLYVPNPVVNHDWRVRNDEFMPIQKLSKKSQKEFLGELEKYEKLYDIPLYLLDSESLSAVQAESAGLRVVGSVPFVHEVGHVCDLLDYIYERLL